MAGYCRRAAMSMMNREPRLDCPASYRVMGKALLPLGGRPYSKDSPLETVTLQIRQCCAQSRDRISRRTSHQLSWNECQDNCQLYGNLFRRYHPGRKRGGRWRGRLSPLADALADHIFIHFGIRLGKVVQLARCHSCNQSLGFRPYFIPGFGADSGTIKAF